MGVLVLLLAAIAGVAMGWIYFRGLLLTVERLPGVRRPAVWLLASFSLRAAAAVTLFLFTVRLAGWPGLGAALVGFVAARTLLLRRPASKSPRSGERRT
jgi:F1F0 ATPase subunit 2